MKKSQLVTSYLLNVSTRVSVSPSVEQSIKKLKKEKKMKKWKRKGKKYLQELIEVYDNKNENWKGERKMRAQYARNCKTTKYFQISMEQWTVNYKLKGQLRVL